MQNESITPLLLIDPTSQVFHKYSVLSSSAVDGAQKENNVKRRDESGERTREGEGGIKEGCK